MRIVLIAVAATMVATMVSEAAAATTYPWCAHYMMQNAPHNCGFVSFEQCLATVTGIGGTCNRNPAYEPVAPRNALRRPARN